MTAPPAVSIVEALLDLIDDGVGGRLAIRSTGRFVDYHVQDEAGRTSRRVRVKGIDDTGSVLSGDLWEALRCWSAGDDHGGAFEFHADGPLFPSATIAVASRLRRFRHGDPNGEDIAVLRAVGVDPNLELLRRIRLRISPGLFAPVLEELRWRAGELVKQSGSDPSSGDDLVAGLLDHFGAADALDTETVVTYEEAVAMVGVTTVARRSREIDTDAVLGRYRAALRRSLEVDGAPRLSGSARPEVPTPGSADAAADGGPVLIALRGGRSLSRPLEATLRREIWRVTGEYLPPRAAAAVLGWPSLVLLVDGWGGPYVEEGLRDEIDLACAANPAITVAAEPRLSGQPS